MDIRISEAKYKNINCLVMESDRLAIIVIPESGGKIQSIFDKAKKKEYLYQSKREEYKKSNYGDNFGEGDTSGFDEVFPSIDTCCYPTGPWAGIQIPDHGEVWAQPWAYSATENSVLLSIHGVRFPYRMEKKIEFLRDNSFRLSYKAVNLSNFDFDFIWAPHPFFLCEADTRIVLPRSVQKIITSCPLPNKLGAYGTIHAWPVTETSAGEKYDISKVYPKYAGKCEKYYSAEKMEEGWCALRNDASGDIIGLSYPVDKLPYLGVWEGIFGKDYITALEPCTGAMDRLDVAKLWNKAGVIEAKSEYVWYLNLTFDTTRDFQFIDADGFLH